MRTQTKQLAALRVDQEVGRALAAEVVSAARY